VDPVPDPLLLRKSGRVGNRTFDSVKRKPFPYSYTTNTFRKESTDMCRDITFLSCKLVKMLRTQYYGLLGYYAMKCGRGIPNYKPSHPTTIYVILIFITMRNSCLTLYGLFM
jgi:hypothetical protein